MTSVPTDNQDGVTRPAWGFVVLGLANIVVGEWKPGSIAAALANYAFMGFGMFWLGLRVRTGYRRRRPYWTRESWVRYLRLAAMPVAAVAVVLFMSTDSGMRLMGSPQSTTRGVWIVILMALLILGGVGLPIAVDWMERGAASEQFTRTRWFQRRRPSAVAS